MISVRQSRQSFNPANQGSDDLRFGQKTPKTGLIRRLSPPAFWAKNAQNAFRLPTAAATAYFFPHSEFRPSASIKCSP
jgi:hypothetical protein